MTTIHELRTSIDRLLDRWEASASTLERDTSTAMAGLAAGLADEKRKVGEAIAGLERALAEAKDMPAAVREKMLALLAAIARDVIAAKVATHQQMLEQRQRMKQAFRDLQQCLDRLDRRVVADIEKAVLRLLLAAKELELKFELLLVRFASAHVDEMVGLAAKMKDVIEQIAAFRQAVSAGWSAAAGQGEDVATELVAQFDRAKDLFSKTFDDLAK
jgi:hypothetical protein